MLKILTMEKTQQNSKIKKSQDQKTWIKCQLMRIGQWIKYDAEFRLSVMRCPKPNKKRQFVSEFGRGPGRRSQQAASGDHQINFGPRSTTGIALAP
jgi:hypothetical protein